LPERGVVGKGEKERKEYFQSIARHFFKLRGAPFFLSSKELDLVDGWEKKEIPLHVVLEGIERSFESYRKKPGRKARIQTLGFCELHVLRAFEQYRDREVGKKKRIVDRDEKKERAKAEVLKFLKAIPLQISYLKEAYSRAQEILSKQRIDEEDLERIEEEIEELLWNNSPDEEKNRIKRSLLAEYKFRDEEEFLRAFKIKLVKVLRDRYKIPYISLYYY